MEGPIVGTVVAAPILFCFHSPGAVSACPPSRPSPHLKVGERAGRDREQGDPNGFMLVLCLLLLQESLDLGVRAILFLSSLGLGVGMGRGFLGQLFCLVHLGGAFQKVTLDLNAEGK
uniref:Uncharacterized protein n=1 Tax=Chromera velia CCMP2878 TaxID=1169474 RepID=A0A0G4IES4_9ALVE|eukprot:Cvel_13821.t1-p1 / transcript=Cvel_13821.t1 / gene=Cvel_13821 / organism=Chromera_velia_CCMP2878 / gene_product=hypothetical protein / transcript_product=hypothetical protein / location=Cvel_scaffold959:33816-34163(-) / protein_length=116 / sequence_SO=supercontig / SO=protein_coding / is_pseudo=false